jgi:hypothetical protein
MDETQAWRDRFVEEVHRRGLHVGETLPDGRVVVVVEDQELVVGLDNLFRQLRQDGGAATLTRFVDRLLNTQKPLPPWPEAAPRIRFLAARPPDEDTDVIAVPVTDKVIGVVAHVGEDEEDVRWVGERQVAVWGISDEELLVTASYNTGALLDKTPITVHTKLGARVVVLESESPHKASLIFSPNLRSKLEPVLGWPVVATIPCRDFVYFFGAADQALVTQHVGPVVRREFSSSSYPLTTEVLHLSEDGITALGWFGP